MDSLSQFVLGASLSVAVMCRRNAAGERRTAVWKAALWGGVCGTLPDLDAFLDHGDPLANMVLHRANSHALFWLTLVSVPLSWLISRVQREPRQWPAWWLAVFLALVTHPLLDWTTVYGTQLLRPFDTRPHGLGSMFVIDPLYTLPLLLGLVVALVAAATTRERRRPSWATRASNLGWRWNLAGLLLSTAYLGWSAVAQQQVRAVAQQTLAAQGLPTERVLVTPLPLNTLAWRVVAMGGPDDPSYHEGFYSLMDPERRIAFEAFPSGRALAPLLKDNPAAQRLADFTGGFYQLDEQAGRLRITDLRMGWEPHYTFRFVVAQRRAGGVVVPTLPVADGSRGPVGPALVWVWRRVWADVGPPPR